MNILPPLPSAPAAISQGGSTMAAPMQAQTIVHHTSPFKPTDGAEKAQDPLKPDTNQAHADLLKNIQGNLLKGHGRKFSRLILFRFDTLVDDPSLRALLFDAASDTNADVVGTKWKITSAYQQWQDARLRATATDRPFYGLGLSLHGLRRCGYADAELPLSDTQNPPMATGFSAAMNDPAVAGNLGDRVATSNPTLPDWESVYCDGVDGVWLLAHADPTQLDPMERRVTDFLTAHRAIKVAVEGGFTWTDVNGKAREPFGFRDGISDPIFFDADCYHDTAGVAWVPKWINLPRSQVLIDWKKKDGGASEHNGGSFLVLRKLEQNVEAFRGNEAVIQDSFAQPAPGAVLPKQAGALLIGRERDGTPLAPLTGPTNQNIDANGPNRFDFGTEESRCPFHAHIRKSAPRVATAPATPPPTLHRDTLGARGALFVRRSAIYDSYGQLPPGGVVTDDPTASPSVMTKSYTTRNGGVITQQAGLLFMGYMSNIVGQFQKLQSDWFGSLTFPFTETEMGDPVIRYNATVGGARVPGWSWPMLPEADVTMLQSVKPKGGAYFYVPSIAWLQKQGPVPQSLWVKAIEAVHHFFSRRRTNQP